MAAVGLVKKLPSQEMLVDVEFTRRTAESDYYDVQSVGKLC